MDSSERNVVKKLLARIHLNMFGVLTFGVMGLVLLAMLGITYVGWILLVVGACLVVMASINWLADSLESRLRRSRPYRAFGCFAVVAILIVLIW